MHRKKTSITSDKERQARIIIVMVNVEGFVNVALCTQKHLERDWIGSEKTNKGEDVQSESRPLSTTCLVFAVFDMHTALILRNCVILTPHSGLCSHTPSPFPSQTLTRFTKTKRRLLNYKEMPRTSTLNIKDSYEARIDASFS
jgi:hypothetical protein